MKKRSILRGKSDTKYFFDKECLNIANYNLSLLKEDVNCDYKIKTLAPKKNVKEVKKMGIKRLATWNAKNEDESKVLFLTTLAINLKKKTLESEKDIRRKIVEVLKISIIIRDNLEKFSYDKSYVIQEIFIT